MVSSTTDAAASPTRLRHPRLAIAALCSSQFLAVLDGLIVSVALPSISGELSISAGDAHWLLNAYLVPFAGLLPLGGKLADLFGRRRVFVAGQAALLLGSVLGTVAPSFAIVLVARVLQARGASASSPARIALAADAFRDPLHG